MCFAPSYPHARKDCRVPQYPGIEWQPHVKDLTKDENLGEFYPGITPRRLVPALVDDGTAIFDLRLNIELLARRHEGVRGRTIIK